MNRTYGERVDDRLEVGYRGAKGLKDAVKRWWKQRRNLGRYHQGKRRKRARGVERVHYEELKENGGEEISFPQ